MALFSGDGVLFLLRWFHFLAGITWIGLLYYFNFVQTPFFASAEAPVRMGMLAGGLVNRALWWFRWGAMVTFITGWLIIFHRMGQGGFFSSSYGWAILFGGLLGSLMWFNVWFVIWPRQKLILGGMVKGQPHPQAADLAATALKFSRFNLYASGPMLFGMIYPNNDPGRSPLFMIIVLIVGVGFWFGLVKRSFKIKPTVD
jgi:uncharacterized membrane protein